MTVQQEDNKSHYKSVCPIILGYGCQAVWPNQTNQRPNILFAAPTSLEGHAGPYYTLYYIRTPHQQYSL